MSALGRFASRALPQLQRALGLGFAPYDAPADPADSPFGACPAIDYRPTRELGTRPEAQHAWLPALSREDPEAACERLGAWLVADVPGRGPDWAHPSDAAARLLRWGLAAAWAGEALDPDLRRRMAGSAQAHARCLAAQLGVGPADHRRVLAASGLAMAGLLFPGLPDARRWWSQGLSALGRALPAQLLADGSPALGGPRQLARAVEAATLVARFAEAAGVALPGELRPALERGGWFLRALRGGLAELPSVGGPAPCPLPVALPIDGGDLVPAKAWRMLSFRDGAWVVAHGRVRSGPARLLVHARSAPHPWGHADAGQVLWCLDDGPVLADPGWFEGRPDLARAGAHGLLVAEGASPSPLSLQVARVDGRKATVTLQAPLGPLTWTRTVRLDGARVLVQDSVEGEGEVAVRSRFPLGAGWALEPADAGWVAERGGRTLSVRVDEGPLTWSLEPAEAVVDGALVGTRALSGRGRLSGGQRLRVRFEIR